MEYNSFLQKCNDNDVIEVDDQLVKLSKLKSDSSLSFSFCRNTDELSRYVNLPPLSSKNVHQLFNGDGVDANILQIGSQSWKKGKIKFKITLEFCPDETEFEQVAQSNEQENEQPESPLDDIRRMMNKEN